MTGFVGATGRMTFSAFFAYFSAVGVSDLVLLSEKIKKHENSKTHLHNSMELALLGTVNIRAKLDSAYWRNIQQYNDTVTKNRNKIDDIINEAKRICTEPQGNKRRRRNNSSHDHRVAALEVYDNVISIKNHLVAASLIFPEHFGEYCGKFPDEKLETTCLAYSELEKSRLKTELFVIYARNDCRDLHGTLSLLEFLIQNSRRNKKAIRNYCYNSYVNIRG
ncbi:unnamed protein product [Acanthoscelides obtectus]|uniref:Uncharacterized protein n=1 Tax=Acanthoscelides obtectus TaxID=200917 RepID=A0A9P0KLC3_ACAOB|nr:unnamed protein product [Acanthoscelides obtectus]CAK1655807.1 hypothetical protein AOBTE_LOCUS19352 [Acanthoscelides obtectus]